MTSLVLIGIGLLLLLIGGLWLLVPALHGLPWIPSREKRIRGALELANLKPGERFYDLGAGDGRVLIMAAQEFKAQAVGIEIGPIQCLVGWLRIWLSGSRQMARIRRGNFYHAKVSDADVIYVYATSTQTSRLRPLLERQLRPGARVVSIAADFPDWKPKMADKKALIFVYEMPPLSGSSTELPLNDVALD